MKIFTSDRFSGRTKYRQHTCKLDSAICVIGLFYSDGTALTRKYDKVLVTGGLGFIGSHTVDLLVAKGHDVVFLDNLELQVHMGKMPRHKNSHAKYILGDIRHRKYWLKAFQDVNSVIHLAGAVCVGQTFR